MQDFDPAVQKAVNRIQSFGETRDIVEALRAAGIAAINIDCMYGLPGQTRDSVAATVEQVLSLKGGMPESQLAHLRKLEFSATGIVALSIYYKINKILNFKHIYVYIMYLHILRVRVIGFNQTRTVFHLQNEQ